MILICKQFLESFEFPVIAGTHFTQPLLRTRFPLVLDSSNLLPQTCIGSLQLSDSKPIGFVDGRLRILGLFVELNPQLIDFSVHGFAFGVEFVVVNLLYSFRTQKR